MKQLITLLCLLSLTTCAPPARQSEDWIVIRPTSDDRVYVSTHENAYGVFDEISIVGGGDALFKIKANRGLLYVTDINGTEWSYPTLAVSRPR